MRSIIKIQDIKHLKKPLRFIISGLVMYLAWILIYEVIIKPHHWVDPWLTNMVSSDSVGILNLLGYKVSQELILNGNIIYNGFNKILKIAYLCDGLILYIVFLIFMLAIPGPAKHKLWFIPAGFIMIYLVNLLRVIMLVMIQIHTPEYLAFNHKYTFTIFVYGFIFLQWYVWIKCFFANMKTVQ